MFTITLIVLNLRSFGEPHFYMINYFIHIIFDEMQRLPYFLCLPNLIVFVTCPCLRLKCILTYFHYAISHHL